MEPSFLFRVLALYTKYVEDNINHIKLISDNYGRFINPKIQLARNQYYEAIDIIIIDGYRNADNY